TLFEAIESRGLIFHGAHASASASAPPREGILDESLFKDLEETLGAEVMRTALATFRSCIGEYITQLDAALAGDKIEAARKIGHAIKGTSFQFGATEVGTLGASIEDKATTLDEMKRAAA